MLCLFCFIWTGNTAISSYLSWPHDSLNLRFLSATQHLSDRTIFYSGIGVSIGYSSFDDRRLLIRAIDPNGPADLEGSLREGDELLRCS